MEFGVETGTRGGMYGEEDESQKCISKFIQSPFTLMLLIYQINSNRFRDFDLKK